MSPTRTSTKSTHLEPTRFQTSGQLILAGLRKHYTKATRTQIPQLWHEVGPHFGKLPAQIGKAGYGVCITTSEDNGEFDYLAAAEVSNVQNLPPNWTHLRIPAQRYAVFPHDGHVSEIATTVKEAFESWEPNSGYVIEAGEGDKPDFIEHYGEGYDPATGTGDIEIWLPVKN
jgi:AraC family transcriptional regulator